jgi:hypothetical protein
MFLLMSAVTLFFHHIFKVFNIETQLFEKYSINMMRSLMCYIISYEAYKNFNYILIDKCLDNENILTKFKNYHNDFLSYFIFDTMLLLFQVYLNIEKRIRMDLLLHHILAISVLTIIDNNKMYGISLMIGLSEGMSIVSGPKLLSMTFGYKKLTNSFIIFRLLYIIFIRMLFIWPMILYYYHISTSQCPNYKPNRNMGLITILIAIIFHTEVGWIHSGRKELARI